MKSGGKFIPRMGKITCRSILFWCSVLLLAGSYQDPAMALGQEAGSLLVFPYYDTHPNALNIITITNTNSDFTPDPFTGIPRGTIDVLFMYVDGDLCSPEDRCERLTPCDTLSLIPAFHNPEHGEEGFLYVYAVDMDTGNPVAFDYLIGTETVFESSTQVSFSLNPLSFKAGSLGPDDHKLALDGFEYEKMPNEILIPRFFGQGQGEFFQSPFRSSMIFMNFTGGARFTAIADLLIYNDNEQVFSSHLIFDCWEALELMDVSAATHLGFLEGTNHDPDEVYIGGMQLETGWLRINGFVSYYYDVIFTYPAIYAVQIEKNLANNYSAATLPFEEGERDNGLLWSTDPNGQ